MRPSRFTKEEIRQALEHVRSGTPAVQECRRLGITETTFYRWRREQEAHAGVEGSEVDSLREENHRLKEIVANLLLDQHLDTPKTRR
ncbi:MAG: transposase [Gemmatimonadota bacterium]|nr:transposase [Gemmatimonadota bacterium]